MKRYVRRAIRGERVVVEHADDPRGPFEEYGGRWALDVSRAIAWHSNIPSRFRRGVPPYHPTEPAPARVGGEEA